MENKISPSSINLMLECPRCFWLEGIMSLKVKKRNTYIVDINNGFKPPYGTGHMSSMLGFLLFLILFVGVFNEKD